MLIFYSLLIFFKHEYEHINFSNSINTNLINDVCIIPTIGSNFHNESLPGKNFTVKLSIQFILINNIYKFKEKKCEIKEDWGYLKNKTWYFIPSIRKILNDYSCVYQPVFRKIGTKFQLGTKSILHHEQKIEDEVIEVKCRKKRNPQDLIYAVEYESLFVQIVNKFNNEMFKKKQSSQKRNCKPLDIMLISYDSVSRSSWIKRLPKTNNFMFNTMKFDLLSGYNIIGDGTPGKLKIFVLNNQLVIKKILN